MATLYKITNLNNGKFYVGSALDHAIRFRTHRRELRKGIHHCSRLQRAWNKHGEEAFRFDVVEVFDDEGAHVEAERQLLDAHFGKPYCYNTGREPGAAFLGRKHTEKAKRKLARAQKGKQHRLGHTNSPEHRAKISAANKGKPKSAAHIASLKLCKLGNSYAKGRVVTLEQRAALGRALIELNSGRRFISVAAAAEHYGIQRPNIARTLRGDGLVKRGPNKGLHFRYLDSQPPSC